jgi:hypothetical protein
MQAVIRQLRKPDENSMPPVDLVSQRKADLLRERRRRGMEAAGILRTANLSDLCAASCEQFTRPPGYVHARHPVFRFCPNCSETRITLPE